MGDRRNFLDADNSMEQSLRFVRSDLEENLNQFFSSGAGTRGGGRGPYDDIPSTAPPRDYKVVQPSPGNRFGYNNLRENYASSTNNYPGAGLPFTRSTESISQQQLQRYEDNNFSRNRNSDPNYSDLFAGRYESSRSNIQRDDRSNDSWNNDRFGMSSGFRKNDESARNTGSNYSQHRNEFQYGNQSEYSHQSQYGNEFPYGNQLQNRNQSEYTSIRRDDRSNGSWNNDRFGNNSGLRNNDESRRNTGSKNTNYSQFGNQFLYDNESQNGYQSDYGNDSGYGNQTQQYRNQPQFGNQSPYGNQLQFRNINGPEQKRPYNNISKPNSLAPANTGNLRGQGARFNKKPLKGRGNSNKRNLPSSVPTASKNARRSTTQNATPTTADEKKRMKKKPTDKYIERRRNANLRKDEFKVLLAEGIIKKPPKGQAKAEPEKYWREWWPSHAYIEREIEKVDKNDEAVKPFLKFNYKPSDTVFAQRKKILLKVGIGKIHRTMDINEVNYDFRDVYKLFMYKKQLEDPNFQKHLDSKQKNTVKNTLNSLKNRKILALLHQSLISRWDNSKKALAEQGNDDNFNARNAKKLFGDKLFHYLVLESIQELKRMTSQEWPGFKEFYDSLKSTGPSNN